ncbi:MAG: hypothetical protein M3409_00140 [Gemmatimonadota bacterium]|nr:hypothetical protein [Gemmatimonadota bacterium]
MTRGWRGGAALAGLALVAAGCELVEVTATPGDDVVVVEATLRTDRGVQTLLVHRSTREGQMGSAVPGARVAVRTAEGREVVFEEVRTRWEDPCKPEPVDTDATALSGGAPPMATCYRSPAAEGVWVRPGATYELDVATPDGRRLRGRTTVPGGFAMRSPAPPLTRGRRVCTLPPGTLLPLVWSRSAGAWSYVTDMQVEGIRFPGVPSALQLTGLSISEADTTLVIPANVGIFERASYPQDFLRLLQGGFPEGVSVRLTVAAVDRNYVNGVRGGSFNPSGRVRVSSVTGDGEGVFGSLVPLTLEVEVLRGPSRLPACLGASG